MTYNCFFLLKVTFSEPLLLWKLYLWWIFVKKQLLHIKFCLRCCQNQFIITWFEEYNCSALVVVYNLFLFLSRVTQAQLAPYKLHWAAFFTDSLDGWCPMTNRCWRSNLEKLCCFLAGIITGGWGFKLYFLVWEEVLFMAWANWRRQVIEGLIWCMLCRSVLRASHNCFRSLSWSFWLSCSVRCWPLRVSLSKIIFTNDFRLNFLDFITRFLSILTHSSKTFSKLFPEILLGSLILWLLCQDSRIMFRLVAIIVAFYKAVSIARPFDFACLW